MCATRPLPYRRRGLPDRPPDKDSPGQRTPPPDRDPLWSEDPTGQRPPSMNRMTDRCKNITLSQTSFVGGKDDKNDKICGLRKKYIILATKLTRLSVLKTQTQTDRVYTHRWNGFVWLLWVVDGNSWAENTVFWNRKVYLRTSLMPNLWLAMMFGKARKKQIWIRKRTHEETKSVLSRSKFLM